MFQILANISFSVLLISTLLSVSCAGQTEEQALTTLRQMTRDNKLPPEDVVANIESRFAGKRTGALAKLLHARIRFEAGDYAGAAAILNSDVFGTKTTVGDHALWLRGQSLMKAANFAEAIKTFDQLVRTYPDSVRYRDAKLGWASAAIASGHAADVPGLLVEFTEKNDPDALLITAKAYEAQNSLTEASAFYRRTYFLAAGTTAAKEAGDKLAATDPDLKPRTADEQLGSANSLFSAKRFGEAASAYRTLADLYPGAATPAVRLKQVTALANSAKPADAQAIVEQMPVSAREREDGYRQVVLGFAKAKMWPQARLAADTMRQKFPAGNLVARTWVDAGLAARDARNRTDEAYFLNTAATAFPDALEVAQAQFESAWFQHESGNYSLSSQMLVEHLARYAGKDTTSRGKAGYWAARDSERAGKTADACALYDGVTYRYGSNWYGYLAQNRITVMKNQGLCNSTSRPTGDVAKALANLRTITVAAETSGPKELARVEKSDELSTVGLFDWAIDELNEAKKTAGNSPKVNLGLARHYRLKGENTAAFVALQKSYPDSAQMFPEEMGREEWAIFYPLTNWSDIKSWARSRNLDPYQVAGLVRQESVFDPRAHSGANAYGLMQLLLPTARAIAKKYGSANVPNSAEDLYRPAVNIELGTAFMRDQLDKFGRIEYVAVAYNAGPGRVAPWRASLPPEIDDFVEAIPFKETKAYVQGVIRNSAQYRRLYDENGAFRPNVGSRPLRSEIDTKPRDQFTAENPEIAVDDEAAE